MKRPAASLLLLFFIGTILFGCATPVRTPVTSQRQIAGVGNLRAEQLKALIDRKAEMVLVDTRTEYEFKQGRIPGAINIAPHRFGSLAGILPRDKSIHLVFYCRGSA